MEEHDVGDAISILGAPTRDGFTFRYWKGSAYNPGDPYTVTGDHTFTAVWAANQKEEDDPEKPSREDGGNTDEPGGKPDGTPDNEPGIEPDYESGGKPDSKPGSNPDNKPGIEPDSNPGNNPGSNAQETVHTDDASGVVNTKSNVSGVAPKVGDDSNAAGWFLVMLIACFMVLQLKARNRC